MGVWWSLIKKEPTKQSKLPSSVTAGATISTKPLKDWFKETYTPEKPASAEDTHPDTHQTTLFPGDTEEE